MDQRSSGLEILIDAVQRRLFDDVVRLKMEIHG